MLVAALGMETKIELYKRARGKLYQHIPLQEFLPRKAQLMLFRRLRADV